MPGYGVPLEAPNPRPGGIPLCVWVTPEGNKQIPYQPLIDFMLRHTCQVLCGGVGTRERREGGCRRSASLPVDVMWEDLYVLTAGGVPLALAGVDNFMDPSVLRVNTLCSFSGSGGGTMLLEHLQPGEKGPTPPPPCLPRAWFVPIDT